MKMFRALSWLRGTIEGRLLLLVACSPVLILPDLFPQYIAVVLAAACFALVIFDSSLRRSAPPLWILLLLLLASVTVSIWVSIDVTITFRKICLMALSFASLQVLTSAQTKDLLRQVRRMTSFLVTGILVLTIAGPFFLQLVPTLEIFGVNPWGNRIWTLPEDVHKNTLGSLLTIGFLLSLVFAASSLKRGRWMGALPGTLAGILLLVMQSRAAIAVSLVVGVVLVGAVTRSRWPRYLVILPLALVFWWVYTAVFVQQPLGLLTRLELWDRSLAALRSLPLTGIGAGAFREVIPLLYPLFSFTPDGTPVHAHSLFLQVALDVGLPGLVAFFAFVFGVLFAGWREMRSMRERQDPLYIYLAGYMAALVSVVLHGLVDSPLWLNKPHPVIFGLAGMIILMATASPRRTPQRPTLVAAFVFLLWLGITLSAVLWADTNPLLSLLTAVGGSVGIGGWVAVLGQPPSEPRSEGVE